MDPPGQRAGAIIAGKYRIQRMVGEGGMGVVFAAVHVQLGQPVAIKLLHVGADERVVQRFVREARVVAQLRSAHVPRMLDVDRLESGEPYLVMELLDGQDLAEIVATRGPLPGPDAVAAVIQACDALSEAHAHGVVHRDLKPANLFVVRGEDGSPCVKVLDFGLAKLRTDLEGSGAEPGLTRTGSFLGSPAYMSPEQWTSAKSADERSDVWALGAILYELLSGETPFGGQTMGELCEAVMHGAPPSLRAKRPELPPELDAVVARCLARNPAARFQSVIELVRALRPFAPGRVLALADRLGGAASSPAEAGPTAVGPTIPASELGAAAAMGSVALDPSLVPSAVPSAPGTSSVAQAPSAVSGSVPWGGPPAPVFPGRSRAVLGVGVGVAVLGVAALAVALVIVLPSRTHSGQGARAPQPVKDPSGSSHDVRPPSDPLVTPDRPLPGRRLPRPGPKLELGSVLRDVPAVMDRLQQAAGRNPLAHQLWLLRDEARLEVYDPQKPGMLVTYYWSNDRMSEPRSANATEPPQGNSFRVAEVDFGRVAEMLADASRRTPDRAPTIASAKLSMWDGKLSWYVCAGPENACAQYQYDAQGHFLR